MPHTRRIRRKGRLFKTKSAAQKARKKGQVVVPFKSKVNPQSKFRFRVKKRGAA